MKYQRHEKAEQVLAKIVATGGDGDDWLALGVAQLAQEKLDKAEGTLKGAQNLMKDNPYPSLHLAKLFAARRRTRRRSARSSSARSRSSPATSTRGPTSSTSSRRRRARRRRSRRSRSSPTRRSTRRPPRRTSRSRASTPTTRRRATRPSPSRRRASSARPTIRIALLVLSALYGQKGKIDEVVKLLAPHEAMMQQDVRLAHNYFEALFQSKDMAQGHRAPQQARDVVEQGSEAVRDRALARDRADAPAAAAGPRGRRVPEIGESHAGRAQPASDINVRRAGH